MYRKFFTILSIVYVCCVAFAWAAILFAFGKAWILQSPADRHAFPVIMIMFSAAMGLFVIFMMIGIGRFVYGDARARGMDAFVWALIAALVPYFVGLIAYLLTRKPLERVCASCRKAVTEEQAFCPYCGAQVRRQCPGCQALVAPSFRYCPHCGAGLPGEQPAGTTSAGQK